MLIASVVETKGGKTIDGGVGMLLPSGGVLSVLIIGVSL